MDAKLTADELEMQGIVRGQQPAGKAWSQEARDAALEARRRNAKPKVTPDKPTHGFPSTGTSHHELSGTAHDMTDRANKKPSAESHNTAAEAHRLAYHAQRRAGNAQLAEDHRLLNIAHLAEARKPKPGKVNRDKVRDAGADDSGRGHDKPLAGERFKPKDKPAKKSFFATGDAVCRLAEPEVKLLVIDAGIDPRGGPWVACREDRPGIAGIDQERHVCRPAELKAWSDAARQAAIIARRGHSVSGEGHASFTTARSVSPRHQAYQAAISATVRARRATETAHTADEHEAAAAHHMTAVEAHRDALESNRKRHGAYHEQRIKDHEREGARHMETASKLRKKQGGK